MKNTKLKFEHTRTQNIPEEGTGTEEEYAFPVDRLQPP